MNGKPASPNPTSTAVEVFQRYLGISEDIALSTHLVADLGVDSLILVTILFEIAEQLGLDLQAAEFDLGSIERLGDVVSLVERVAASS